MEIDGVFEIVFSVTSRSGSVTSTTIPASEFFDHDEYEAPEWACDLPWRRLTLQDYLEGDSNHARCLSVVIRDLRTNQERVVHIEQLGDSQLTLSWNDRLAHPDQL